MIDKIIREDIPGEFENVAAVRERLDYFRKISVDGIHSLSPNEQAKLKHDYVRFFNVQTSLFADTYPTHLFRITKNKSIQGGNYKLQKISNLIGPPSDIARIGRCNLPKESVFYAALDLHTAIWETKPAVGDVITLTEWKIRPNKHLNVHFVFHPSETNHSMESKKSLEEQKAQKHKFSPEIQAVLDELLIFFCEEFRKTVTSEENINYLFSALMSSQYFFSPANKEPLKIDAICYPSVQRKFSVSNVAIINSLVLDRLEIESATTYTVTGTNYNDSNQTSSDLISVSPLKCFAKEMDYANDRIIWDLERELKDVQNILEEERKLREDS